MTTLKNPEPRLVIKKLMDIEICSINLFSNKLCKFFLTENFVPSPWLSPKG